MLRCPDNGKGAHICLVERNVPDNCRADRLAGDRRVIELLGDVRFINPRISAEIEVFVLFGTFPHVCQAKLATLANH